MLHLEQKKVDIGCKWAWVTVTRIIIQRSARYIKQEIMINPTFCLTKKCYPDTKAAYWKFSYTPLPPNPSPPEQKMIMQPIKWGIYLNCVSAKAIEFLALFNYLETRKFWYIIQGLRLIVKAKHSRISASTLLTLLLSCFGISCDSRVSTNNVFP